MAIKHLRIMGDEVGSAGVEMDYLKLLKELPEGCYAFDVFLVPRRGYVPNGLAEQLETVSICAEMQKMLIRNKMAIILDAHIETIEGTPEKGGI